MKTMQCYNDSRLIQVDDEDFERLNKLKWRFNGQGAIQTATKINNKWYYVNITCAIFKRKSLFDHEDRNIWNNQKYNLREATKSQDCANRLKKLSNKTSKFRGVCFHKRDKIFTAKATKNGIQYFLGYFKTAIEAALVYDKKITELFGEFALTNKKLGLL